MGKYISLFTILLFCIFINFHKSNSVDHEIKYIKMVNKTHFSCEDEMKILDFNKFNDDYCDCEDGADENSKYFFKLRILLGTNACNNGKFYCPNRFYESKIISTSKLNDGICDCCDGSDESSLGCPKTCLDLSSKEYDKLMDNFLTLKMIVTNFNEENYLSFFNYNKNVIQKVITSYSELKDLLDRNFLLKSYLNKMEHSMTDDNEEYVDSHGVSLKYLRIKIESINERIRYYDKFLNENENLIKSYEIFSIFIDVNEDCQKVSYKHFECEICSSTLKCSGYKGNKYRTKFLGNLVKFENNALFFENGAKCFYYNKKFSAKVHIECGSSESIKFKEKIGGCHYEFVYTTKMGCNSLKVNALQERIKVFLREIQ